MKKFSRKKKWIVFAAAFLLVVTLGATVFFACSGGGEQPYTEPPAQSMSYRLDPPEDGSLPEDHTQLENLGYIVGRLMSRRYYHTDSVSKASASALFGAVNVEQNVTGTKDYKDGVLIVSSVSISGSSFAPSKALQRFIGEEKAVVRYAASGNKDDWKGADTEWASGEPAEILSKEQYPDRYGLWPTEFSDYVLREETIRSFGEIGREGDAYLLSFELDPASATYYYANQMVTMGELNEKPVFSSVKVTLRYAADWTVSEMRIEEEYTSKKGIEADVSGLTVITYSYDEADVDVSDYEEYFIRYAQAETTGPAETERTASDYLAEGFGSVLAGDRTAFAIEAQVAGQTVRGTALLSVSGGAPVSLQLCVGSLGLFVDLGGGRVYINYKDFNGALALDDAAALFGVSGGSLDGLLPSLESALAGGTVRKGEGSAVVSVTLPLGGLSLPLSFGFSETDAGVAWTYIDTFVAFSDTEISLRVTPAPADTELPAVDTESAVDLYPYIKDILALVQGEAFSLTVNYAGNGFSLAGDVVVDAASGAASGDVVLTAGGASVPVAFTCAGGEIWLSAGGAKVRAQAGEWLDALLPLLGVSSEMPDIDVAGLLGALVSADYDAIVKGLSLTEGRLSLTIDGDALLAAFAPDADVTLGDVTAVYDKEKGSFSVGALGAELTLAGTEEEVRLPADAESYVALRPDDVLRFIEPVMVLAASKDIAFEGYAETEIEGLKFTLDITGEVWFADPEAVRVYLGLTVNGTEEIEIYYADGKVTLACGAYGMEIAESELKSLAEKFSSLFASEENAPVSALLLGSDGLDLAALLNGIKLLGANENGIQFAADLSALLDGMNVTARIGTTENGLTLTEGRLTAAGVAMNSVSARVYAAENAFVPDFSGVTMCDNVFELLLNAYIQFAGSEFLTISFDYEDGSMKADLTAALRLKQTEENIVFELAAEAIVSAGGSNYYMQVSVVDAYAYIYFSLIGFENSACYPEAVAEGVSPLRAKIAVSSLFGISSEAMPLIVSLLGLDKNELYYFNFVVELLGGTYETINSDIFGVKTAEEWADLIVGIIGEYTGNTRATNVSSESMSVAFDAENLSLILSGNGMNVVLSAGGEREIAAPSEEYTDYSSLAELVKVLMRSITQSKTTEDAEGNPVESAEINGYYYLSGKISAGLDLGSIFGKHELTDIPVAASVYLDEESGGVTVNLHVEIPYFVLVIKEDTRLDLTIKDGMVYIVRTTGSETLYRVSTMENFFGDILSHLGFLFNFSDMINDKIAGSGDTAETGMADIGSILTSYAYDAAEGKKWMFGLDLSSVTGGVLENASVSLTADEGGTLKSLLFSTALSVLTLDAQLDYINPGENMENGHGVDITSDVSGEVSALFGKAIAETDWTQTSYLEGKAATLTYKADGQTLGTQTVAYDTATGELLSYTELPDLSSLNNGSGYTFSWGSIGAVSGDTAIEAVKTPNEYTVTIRSEYEIEGMEYVRTEGGYYLYELTYTYGTRLDLPVGTEYEKTYELVAFEGQDGGISCVENITSDVVLTAVWEKIEYTVTYTVLGEVYATQTYGYGDALVLPEASAEGFAFEGWDTDALAVESDMTVEAILSVSVTLGSDFAAEGFTQSEGGWYREYALQGKSEQDFAFGLSLQGDGHTQFGWWHEGEVWQYVSNLAGLDGQTVWTAWIGEVKVEVTEAKKSWGTWTINGRYTGGAFEGAVSEQIAASAGISRSAQAWLKLSKDGVNDFDTLNGGDPVSVAADGSFGKGSMTSASDLFGSAKYGGAKVAITYTYGELSLTLEGAAWKAR